MKSCMGRKPEDLMGRGSTETEMSWKWLTQTITIETLMTLTVHFHLLSFLINTPNMNKDCYYLVKEILFQNSQVPSLPAVNDYIIFIKFS